MWPHYLHVGGHLLPFGLAAAGAVVGISTGRLGSVGAEVLRGSLIIGLLMLWLLVLVQFVCEHLVELGGGLYLGWLMGLRLRADLAPRLLAHDALAEREVCCLVGIRLGNQHVLVDVHPASTGSRGGR